VNFDQVVAQHVSSRHIDFCEAGIIPHPGNIFDITTPFRVFGQYEELLSVAQRNGVPVTPECSNVDGTNMTRKPVESTVIPEEHLGPVRHVFMPEWSWTDRVQYGTPLFSFTLIVDLHGRPVPITLDVLFLGSAEDFQIHNTR